MSTKDREATSVDDQFSIAIDLAEGDNIEFDRSDDDEKIRGEIIEVTSDGMDYYGDFVPKYIFIEGEDGEKYVLEPTGMEANEPTAALYRMAEDWPNKESGRWSRPDTRGGDDEYLRYDVLRASG